jgi:hypothetical protein
MKINCLLIFLLLLWGCTGQQKKETLTPNDKKVKNVSPEFEITEEIHNFGTLQAGEVVVYIFEYQNVGKGTLEVNNIESGCDCLTIEPQERVVKSGQTGKIKVIFDTSGLYGNQFQAFRVLSSVKGIGMDLAVSADVLNENIDNKQN